jgi:hypothetical protein
MNEAFVCVKVDREERPDVDQVYMTVCQLLTGSGGWPLTVIMTPDRRPFFAGTYFPKESRFGATGMRELVPRIAAMWRERRGSLVEAADEVTASLAQAAGAPATGEVDPAALDRAYEALMIQFDAVHGGFGPRAPAVPLNDTLHGGQADARSMEFRLGVQPLKRLEQFPALLHVEARAIIPYEVRRYFPMIDFAEFDAYPLFPPGELPGVFEQVLEHHLYQNGVAYSRNSIAYDEFHAPVRFARNDLGDDAARHHAQVERLAAHLRAA